MTRSAKRRFALIFAALAAGSIIIFFASNGSRPQPIEGLWKSVYYGGCLCDSEHLLEFKDGKITRYSNAHLTDFGFGEYEKLADGLYRVTLFNDDREDSVWEVRPGSRRWLAPPDETEPWFRRWARRFYRPLNTGAYQRLIATAQERDTKLRAAFATLEAKNETDQHPHDSQDETND